MHVVFILLNARVPKDRIYPVLVTQARYVAPDISGVSKSMVKDQILINLAVSFRKFATK